MTTVNERYEVLAIPPRSAWDTGRADDRALVRRAHGDATLLPSQMAVVGGSALHEVKPSRPALAVAVRSPIFVVVPEREIVYSVRVVQARPTIMPDQARAAEAYQQVAALGPSTHLLDCSA